MGSYVVADGDLSNSARTGAGLTAGPVRAWAELFLVLGARVYRAFLLTLVAAALVPTLWSWTSYVVGSGSMAPALSVGDVVVARPLPEDARVPKGVMVFTDPVRDRILIHRVVERLGDGTFITAGDANEATDSTPVPRKSFLARGTICVPFVGLPIVWVQNRDVIPLLLWGLLTVGAFLLAGRRQGPPRHRLPSPHEAKVGDGAAGKSKVLVRGTAAIAAAGLLALGVAMAPFEHADAAFSAQTVSSGSTWKVAVVSSNATSHLRVYDTPEASGWYRRSSVSVNIYATASPGSVRSITYRVNDGSPVTIKSASIVFNLSRQGDNTITYFATDNHGVAETAHTVHIKLDNVSPTLSVTSRVGDMTHAQWRANCPQPGSTGGVCGATVDTASGVASVTYVLSRSSDQRCFDGAAWTSAACSARTAATFTTSTWVALVPDALLQVPRTWYTITVFVTDVAGNSRNITRSFSVG